MRCDTVRCVRTIFWSGDGWPTAGEWSAFWAFTTFAVALVAAILALSQLRIILLEREERERPYLAVDFEFRSLLVLIAVENISSKLATNVTLKSVPLPESTRGDRLDRLERVFDGNFVIPQVAPGRRMSWHVDLASTLLESDSLPRRFEVTARYCDPLARSVGWFGLRSARPEPRRYEDTFILDLDQYGYAATDQDYDNKNWIIAQRNERRLDRIAAATERIVVELRTRDESERGH